MRRASALLSVLMLLCLLLLTGCKKETIAGKSFRFPLSDEPQQIDPQVSTDAASVTLVASLFEGLARLDESGTPVPGAATWTISEDGLTYTFTLKDSEWHNDTTVCGNVTAYDFVFGMQRAVMPSTQSTLAEQLFDIQNAREINDGSMDVSQLGVKAVSDTVLVITLVEPNDEFLAKTATTPFMPCNESFFESTGGHYGLETKYIMTNGPFYLKKWTHDTSLVLSKNQGYYDADSILPATVTYVIGDVTDAVTQLKDGSLDAAPLASDELDSAKTAGLSIVTQEDSIQYIWFNNKITSLSNAQVRCALRGALEWDTVVSQLNSKVYTKATGFISPDALLSGNETYRTSANSLSVTSVGREALSELTAGLQQLGLSTMPQLTLLCENDEYSLNLARYIVQSWQKNLSVYFDIETLTSTELATRVKVGNYEIALYSSTAPGSTALDALSSFGTGATGNLSHFSNTTYDELLTEASSGNVSRNELENLEKVLWDSCPSIPLSFVKQYVGIAANDSGIIVRSFGGGAFGAPYDFRSAGKKED